MLSRGIAACGLRGSSGPMFGMEGAHATPLYAIVAACCAACRIPARFDRD